VKSSVLRREAWHTSEGCPCSPCGSSDIEALTNAAGDVHFPRHAESDSWWSREEHERRAAKSGDAGFGYPLGAAAQGRDSLVEPSCKLGRGPAQVIKSVMTFEGPIDPPPRVNSKALRDRWIDHKQYIEAYGTRPCRDSGEGRT
jgi:hypothetical protein